MDIANEVGGSRALDRTKGHHRKTTASARLTNNASDLMPSAAILVGNSEYRHLGELACCRADVFAMQELLQATEKYATIEIVENFEADDLKSKMRAMIDGLSNTDELFFYFTGHGYQLEDEFYYCATAFDVNRPNETGLSTSELHVILESVPEVL